MNGGKIQTIGTRLALEVTYRMAWVAHCSTPKLSFICNFDNHHFRYCLSLSVFQSPSESDDLWSRVLSVVL